MCLFSALTRNAMSIYANRNYMSTVKNKLNQSLRSFLKQLAIVRSLGTVMKCTYNIIKLHSYMQNSYFHNSFTIHACACAFQPVKEVITSSLIEELYCSNTTLAPRGNKRWSKQQAILNSWVCYLRRIEGMLPEKDRRYG